MSGLGINFSKSELIGIRMEKSVLHDFTGILGCNVVDLPATYLGLPLCVGSATKSLWNPVVGGGKGGEKTVFLESQLSVHWRKSCPHQVSLV